MWQQVLEFWFSEISPEKWWVKDEQFDSLIRQRYLTLLEQAKRSELHQWRETAQGSLAEIIVLDQFSRNVYRDKPQAFEADSLALALAQVAIAKGFDQQLPAEQRSFMYLPFMHSESELIHQQAIELYTAFGQENSLDFELRHKAIIDRFGRYPHRNNILGRVSTAEEVAFLKEPDSSF